MITENSIEGEINLHKKIVEKAFWLFQAKNIGSKFLVDSKGRPLAKSNQSLQRMSKSTAIKIFRIQLYQFCSENNLQCSAFHRCDCYFYSITPYPIFVGIEKETGDINISCPNIGGIEISYYSYECAFQWIKEYMNINTDELYQKQEEIAETYTISPKNAEIATKSISTLINNFYKKEDILEMVIKNTRTFLRFEYNKKIYSLYVVHSFFLQDPVLFLNLLRNPKDVFLFKKIICAEEDSSRPSDSLYKKFNGIERVYYQKLFEKDS